MVEKAAKELGFESIDFVVETPADIANGDYSTNIAMSLLKGRRLFENSIEGSIDTKNVKYGPNFTTPREIAEGLKKKILDTLKNTSDGDIEKIEIAGPGFINFYLSRKFFTNSLGNILEKGENFGKTKTLSGKKIMVEYTDPNPFKPFHIGHLMSNAIGESISRLIESQGADVVRANYQGDVGLHVAKAIYGLQQKGMPEESLSVSEQAIYIGECYSYGSNEYEDKVEAKEEINKINKAVYEKSDSEINKIYEWGRKVTLEAFESIYDLLGTKFDYYFFEGKVAQKGIDIVRSRKDIFTESDGAIVFHGEKYDPKLHTRVFINSQGLPTYETKEIGLTTEKFETEKDLSQSVVITANEQSDYFKVVSKAIEVMHPEMGQKMKHIAHGMLRFAEGKMSSRKGNIITGESLLRDAKEMVLDKMKDRDITDDEKEEVADIVSVAAIKYSILKQSIGGDIIYDFEKSISFEGDSGPYLQYGVVRINSLLGKANKVSLDTPTQEVSHLERILHRYEEVLANSAEEYAPQKLVNFLVEVVAAYNNFYANHQIISDDEYSSYKVALTKATGTVLTNGLHVLGMKIPKKM